MATVLVLDEGLLEKHYRYLLVYGKEIEFVYAKPELDIAEQTKALDARLLMLSVGGDRVREMLVRLRQLNPGLSIFAVIGRYDFGLEQELLSAGATAVFSRFDEASTILANIEATLGKQQGENG